MNIPEKLWKLIVEFLAAKKNGQIVLHVKDGDVQKMDMQETVKP